MRYFEYDEAMTGSEMLARQLERDPAYKVLRRLPEPREVWLSTPSGRGETTVAVVDCETTGLDPDQDRLIEVAVCLMTIDVSGALTRITRPSSMLECPGVALDESISRITGLRDSDLDGRRFNEEGLRQLISEASGVVAYNASFDRAFMTRRFPWLETFGWACAAREIDWKEMGYEGRALGHLLASAGHHHDGHRAGSDAWALSCLLAMQAPDERVIAAHLLDRAQAPSVMVTALNVPFELRMSLKLRGYRWQAGAKAWERECDTREFEAERDWLIALDPFIKVERRLLDWTSRYVER